MARYTGPVCRLCRRERVKLFLKGQRCYTGKCAMSEERKPNPPGPPPKGMKKPSNYAIQLREKQKTRRIYGLMERQFRTYFHKAVKQAGVTGENLLRFLERRADNVVFRLGLGYSRSQARQLVLHGHIRINGKKVDIPSYLVKAGDVVEVKDKSKNLESLRGASLLTQRYRKVPEWLEFDIENLRGRVISLPSRNQIDTDVKEQMIVELYSK